MENELKKIMAIDPGAERIGVAISDLTATIANPLTVIKHVQRNKDAERIVTIALEKSVKLIVIGQAFYSNGEPNPSGRKSARLAEAIMQITDIPVILWDEHESTQLARKARREMGVKKKQNSHLDDLAATIILQTYLDSLPNHSNYSDHSLES
ncbi:MAG: Holliday junction resolvase RuvX [Chloroflexi bacterium HGW-Chloroflexi-2]|jgi:putative Holliday junction resolvase|nr:MAG: Holliday junction resolvase RuvX [Chloroflexi bacterium HGW-Chloroflexi-2]